MPVKQCALCASSKLVLVIDLGPHPLADTFVRNREQAQSLPRYPLTVLRCRACGHVMNGYRVPPKQRYQETEYSYDSSNSDVAIEHFTSLAYDIGRYVALGPNDLAVDIGGNIGTLLTAFRGQFGARVLNVEPSPNIANIARSSGVETVQCFWGQEAAENVVAEGGAKVITATNALNHIDDPSAFFQHIAQALQPDGIFVAEVPYLLTLIERDAFDTMYLEHVSYFAVEPLRRFLASRGLNIMRAQLDSYMGGSIRFMIGRGPEGKEVAALAEREHTAGLYDEQTYERFRARVARLKDNLLAELRAVKAAGGVIIGIGAATKGNTLLNYCGIDGSLLEFITDVSVLKIGKYTPGSTIPIRPDAAVTEDITHALILPWNIANFLKKKLGRKYPKLAFIVPHMEE